MRAWAPALAVIAIVGVSGPPSAHAEKPVRLKLKIDGVREVHLEPAPPGSYAYVVTWQDGTVERLDPERFTEALYGRQTARPWVHRLLNITTPVGFAWVALGLLGQVLFTGRMIVQWIASERQRRSHVPVAFWWMSLVGASMLLTYFVWRKDIVGVLGQATGWLIYVRNLVLIYRPGV